jgi:hypothetical protein
MYYFQIGNNELAEILCQFERQTAHGFALEYVIDPRYCH